jgi:membrane-bound lytic murein transglycosylase D
LEETVTGQKVKHSSLSKIIKLTLAMGLFAVAACQSNTQYRSAPRLSLDGSQISMLEKSVITGTVPRAQSNKPSPRVAAKAQPQIPESTQREQLATQQTNTMFAANAAAGILPETRNSAADNSAQSSSTNTKSGNDSESSLVSALTPPPNLIANGFDSDEDEDEDAALVEESAVDEEKEALDADSARSPEEMAELLLNTGIEGQFALCEGSVYMEDWQGIFENQFITANRHRYKKASQLKKALEEARAEEYTRLLMPTLPNLDFDYPVVINGDVIKWIQYFQTRGRKAFVTWLRRAEDIIPQSVPVLEKYGLPKDLIYLAMIESGFNNRALSSARAAGTWQFMRATGRSFGLKQNDYVDERRDPEKSTVAAARYLTYLYTLFGDWHLAAASYNAGEGRVARSMRGQKESSFFALSAARRLPNETRNYVPKLIAAMIISKNPSRFGFEVSEGSRAVRTRSLALEKSIRLPDLAAAIEVDQKVLENLNPELRLGITPPGSAAAPYLLRVPESSYATAIAAVDNLPQAPRTFYVAARVKKRESVSQFAGRYGITLATLLKANPGIRPNARLSKGQSLKIPVALGSGQYERLTRDERSSKRKLRASASKRSRSVKYATRRSKRGD